MHRINHALRELLRQSPLAKRLAGGPVSLRLRAPHYLLRGHLVRAARIERYVRSSDEPRLQLGSGPHSLPGWLDSDLRSGEIYLDISRPFPVRDASLTYIYAEHVIEHVPEPVGVRMLREAARVLQPGGVLRITTPDLHKILAIYEDRNPVIGLQDYARFLDTVTAGKRHVRACQMLNSFMREWGHEYIYDEEDLTAKLLEGGFARVDRREPGESPHATLRGLERHGPEWENAAEAMCLEAVAP